MIRFENGEYFNFESVGEFHLKNEWIHPRRVLKSNELILVLEGTLFLNEDGKDYELHKNDIILLESGKLHFGTKAVREPVAFYWMHFTANTPMPFKAITGADVYDIKYLLKKLLHNSRTDGVTNTELDAISYTVFKEAAHLYEGSESSVPVKIGLIKEYVKNNIERNITVDEISASLGYNTDYIGKLFKKHTGVSLKTYIAKQKINLANSMLLTTDMSIKEIASYLGYTDENLFIKFYKYHEKISPAKFKNKYFNTHLNNK